METCCWRAAASGLGGGSGGGSAQSRTRSAEREERRPGGGRRVGGLGWAGGRGGAPGQRGSLRSARPASAAGFEGVPSQARALLLQPASGRLSLGESVSREPGTPRVRAGEFTVAPNTCPLRASPAVAAILKKLRMGPRGSWEMRDLLACHAWSPNCSPRPRCFKVEQLALKVGVKASYEYIVRCSNATYAYVYIHI